MVVLLVERTVRMIVADPFGPTVALVLLRLTLGGLLVLGDSPVVRVTVPEKL